MRKLIQCNFPYVTVGQGEKLTQDAEEVAMTTVQLASAFLFTVWFHTKKSLRGNATDWYEILSQHLRCSPSSYQGLVLEQRVVQPAQQVQRVLTGVAQRRGEAVNESIRHHKLSSKEIQFSRDLASNDNLPLDDSKIAEIVTQHRMDNNPYSVKSKSRTKEPARRANAVEGQLVFHKQEGNKNTRRDLYIVIGKDTANDTLTICNVRDAISNKGASIVPQDIHGVV